MTEHNSLVDGSRTVEHVAYEKPSFLGREYWVKESASVLGGAVVLVVIALVLNKYDGHPVTDWSGSITLNALLALLVTILYVFLHIPLSACVYQIRWNHFSKPHSLSDFERYDAVNRGAFGALRLLVSRSQSPSITFAAVLMLAVTAIGPFTQQLLDIEVIDRVIPGSATVPIASKLQALPPQQTGETTFIKPDGSVGSRFAEDSKAFTAGAQGAIYGGAFYPAATSFNVTTQCDTGNCTWDGYSTLAVRSQVTNITDKLVYADRKDVASWLKNITNITMDADRIADEVSMGNNISVMPKQLVSAPSADNRAPGITLAFALESVFGYPNPLRYARQNRSNSNTLLLMQAQPVSSFWPVNDGTNSNFLTVHMYYQELVLNGTAGNNSWWNTSIAYGRAGAWECKFDITVQSFRMRMVNGKFSEEPVGSPVPYTGPSCADKIDSNCSFNYTANGTTYPVNQIAAQYMAGSAFTLFQANASESYSYSVPASKLGAGASKRLLAVDDHPIERTQSFPSMNGQFLYQVAKSEVLNATGAEPATLGVQVRDVMGNIARSTTTWLREASGQAQHGAATRTYIVYAVRWRWLSIPVILLVFTAALLGATVVDTRRKGLPGWTDSALAALTHGVDGAVRQDLLRMRNIEDIERAARNIKVFLRKGDFTLQRTEMSDTGYYPIK